MKVDLTQALESLDEARLLESDEGTANALFKVGVGYLQRGSLDAAAEALDEALHLCTKLENPVGRGQVLLRLAELAAAANQPEAALERLSQAEESFRSIPDQAGLASALERKGNLLEAQGDLEGAAGALEEALRLAQEAGDELSQLLLYQYLAPLYRKAGHAETALEAYRRLGVLCQALNDPQREALALVGVGALLAQRGDVEEADQALAGAQELFHRMALPQQAKQVAAERERLKATD
ncbi:MAG: tetratricopeptide repeat protein [Desulfarculaceae bacterium]|nr:tetratricopeptide repeat protein [Desulfarculaceae bacterium]